MVNRERLIQVSEAPSLPQESHLLSRREFLYKVGVAAGLAYLLLNTPPFLRSSKAEASTLTAPQVVPVDHYDRSLGWHRSYPWLPADGSDDVEGPEATGFHVWDKYDALDRIINGSRARSVYWRPTKDWLIEVAFNALHTRGEAYYQWVKGWAGYCMDGAAASFFAPKIEGDITVEGVNFTERDRLVVATMRWGGLARDAVKLDPDIIRQRIINREAVVVNHSRSRYQDWWGLVRRVRNDGSIEITRTLKWTEDGLQTEYRTINELYGAYSLDENKAQPGFAGNFAVVDRKVGGLIVGTHKLAA